MRINLSIWKNGYYVEFQFKILIDGIFHYFLSSHIRGTNSLQPRVEDDLIAQEDVNNKVGNTLSIIGFPWNQYLKDIKND